MQAAPRGYSYEAEPAPIDERERRFFEILRARAQEGELREWWDKLKLGGCMEEWFKMALVPARALNEPLLNSNDTPGLWVSSSKSGV